MAKKKPGEVVRISSDAYALIERSRQGKESVAKCLKRLLGLSVKKNSQTHEKPDIWVLKSAGLALPTVEEARGAAILKSVEETKKLGVRVNPEEPIPYKEVRK